MSSSCDPPGSARGELFAANLARHWLRARPRTLEPCPPQVFTGYDIPPAPHTPARPGPDGSAPTIPRIVWSYWHDAAPPPLIAACVANWHRHAPGFEIRMLNARSLHDWLPAVPASLAQAGPVLTADWARLELLRLHGGVWLDASTVLTASPEWAIDVQAREHAELVGYYLERYTTQPLFPVLENWCLAAPPGSRFVEDLQQEFAGHVLPEGNAAYIERLRRAGLYDRVRQAIDMPDYLSMHLAAQTVMQTRGGYRLALSRAEDGPYFYHRIGGWNRNRLRARLLMYRADGGLPPLIKLRKPDRRRLDVYVAQGLTLPGSLIDRYLALPPPAGG